MAPLAGTGFSPVLVSGTKAKFMNWISRGLRRGLIEFPESNGPIRWPAMAGFLKRGAGHRECRGTEPFKPFTSTGLPCESLKALRAWVPAPVRSLVSEPYHGIDFRRCAEANMVMNPGHRLLFRFQCT
jgi:hypothetical protein